MEENTPPTGPPAGPAPAPPEPPRTGLLASVLTPVEPARPIATSATQHGSEAPAGTPTGPLATSDGHPRPPGGESVPRALLLALVERWRAAPALAQKRLDVAREKAKALQVKENRTTQATSQAINKTERRSDGKTEARTLGEHKNHRQDQSQRRNDGKNHRDTRQTGTTSRQDRTDHKNERRHDGKDDRKNHHTRDHKGTDTRENRRRADHKNERRHDGKNHHDRTHTDAPATEDRRTGRRGGHEHPAAPRGDRRRSLLGGLFKKNADDAAKVAQADAPRPVTNPHDPTTPQNPGKDTQRQDPHPPHAKNPTTKETEKTKEAGKDGTAPRPQPSPIPQPATRASREAGYRDGHRAGRMVQHVKAYRDGTRDGYTDATAQGAREKQALDAARARRQTTQPTRPQQKQEPPVPTTTTVHPIEVKDVDALGVTLGAGAAKPYLTRGEIRTMKQFERRLLARAQQLATTAERTRGLKAHAEAQARRARTLADLTRSVKGGATLLPALDRLAETAEQQAAKAAEIHTRALRAAEKARTVAVNVQRRDGLIYRAVLDSPETEPAEMTFYQGD